MCVYIYILLDMILSDGWETLSSNWLRIFMTGVWIALPSVHHWVAIFVTQYP